MFSLSNLLFHFSSNISFQEQNNDVTGVWSGLVFPRENNLREQISPSASETLMLQYSVTWPTITIRGKPMTK